MFSLFSRRNADSFNHVDKSKSKSSFLFEDYSKDYYQYNTERIEQELCRRENDSESHRIRIKVNYENDDQFGCNADKDDSYELDSGASVSVIDINDSSSYRSFSPFQQPFNNKHIECNKLKSDNGKQQYNEKAIDVPKDFEERAYGRCNKKRISVPIRNLNSTQVQLPKVLILETIFETTFRRF